MTPGEAARWSLLLTTCSLITTTGVLIWVWPAPAYGPGPGVVGALLGGAMLVLAVRGVARRLREIVRPRDHEPPGPRAPETGRP